MGMHDGYDPDQAKIVGTIFFVFMLVLCLFMVGANLFAGATIAWKWVFAPVWGPFVLGIIMMLCGIKPPGQ